MATRPPPILEVCFQGPGMVPEKIPITTLAKAFRAVHRLAAGRETAHVEGQEIQEEPFRLLQVMRGLAVFRMGGQASPLVMARLRETGRVLKDPETVGDKSYMLHPIEDLSAIARALECEILLREPSAADGVLARIGPDSYQDISRSILVSGDTSFVGVVKRVGGATAARCALRVPFQHHLFYCRVASENPGKLVRKLGKHIYEEVVVHGKAVWLNTTWQVVSFTIYEMSKPKPGSLREVMDELRQAGGDAWDEVDDPESYLEEMSGER